MQYIISKHFLTDLPLGTGMQQVVCVRVYVDASQPPRVPASMSPRHTELHNDLQAATVVCSIISSKKLCIGKGRRPPLSRATQDFFPGAGSPRSLSPRAAR